VAHILVFAIASDVRVRVIGLRVASYRGWDPLRGRWHWYATAHGSSLRLSIATLGGSDRAIGCKLKTVTVRDLIRLIESDGWNHVRTTGSHRHVKHKLKPHVVTVPGSTNDDVPTGSLKAILRSAALEHKK